MTRTPIVTMVSVAEKALALLRDGRFTTTYKYAVLLGLIDACMENTRRTGAPPDFVTTPQLARRVIEMYWPQSVPYDAMAGTVLTQSRSGRDTQAEIVASIQRFRTQSERLWGGSLTRARLGDPANYRKLCRRVEWKLIEMPLPRLQRIGGVHDAFLYTIAWDDSIRGREVAEYQKGHASNFDNRILFRPGAAEALVTLNGVLRPVIHREWAAFVASSNRLEESLLERFLFGVSRTRLESVRAPLQELQEDRCFYCGERLAGTHARKPHVDHFVPWSRYPNDAIENLVIAHERCNARKREHLAASHHISRWRGRLDDHASVDRLQCIAREANWESAADRTLAVARAIYFNLPADMPLWLAVDAFAHGDVPRARELLARSA
jgi:hypothetical protein